jgi:hypothetical protein
MAVVAQLLKAMAISEVEAMPLISTRNRTLKNSIFIPHPAASAV